MSAPPAGSDPTGPEAAPARARSAVGDGAHTGSAGGDGARTGSAVGLAVHASVPERDVTLDVDLPAGQVLGVLGANGAGKSTLLGLIAGTVRPASGSVRVGRTVVADGATWVPPHRRRVSLLAQEPLLFPHLDVLANVAFGPRSAGSGRREAEQLAHERLAQVGAGDLAGRRPGKLSGGQAQRVSLARALAPDPDVVLLDEPLSALDVEVAAAMRQLLRELLRGTGRSAVLVTHDLLDVLAVADTVVVLDGGRVVERGPTLDVLTRPRSSFAAALAGVNLVAGSLDGTGADAAVLAPAPRPDEPPLLLHGLADPALMPGAAVAATFSPRAVAVHLEPPGGSPRNTVGVTVTSLEQQGELVRVRARTDGGHVLAADITPASVAALGLAPNVPVLFAVKAAEVALYPA
ncbi:MAG: sulfate/molybdate ABC transporter ATP-binding protein [Georgenia sp.]